MILQQICAARTATRALSISSRFTRPIVPVTMPLRAKLTISNAMAEGRRSQSSAAVEAPAPEVNPADDVLFDSRYGVRSITLNRPAKYNALNGSMAGKILPRLQEWQKSDIANIIVIKGAGEKAFCAGGDVKALADLNATGAEGSKQSLDYFALEYRLDNLIAKITKPYVAFMDGITMGGGVGLSLHGHFRIATERTLFAMPETTIGFFPDVGASFFLPRMDGYLGTYLALTSERLAGVQAYWAGVATHYIHSSSLADLEERLSELKLNDWDDLQTKLRIVNSTIEEFVTGLPAGEEFKLGGQTREAIDRCFQYNSVDEILYALEQEKTEWANKTIETLHARSPTSVRVSLLEMRYGAGWSINTAFQREHHMAAKFMDNDRHPDFVEGVTKQLSKEKLKPEWKPATLAETTDEQALKYFEVEEGDDWLQLIKQTPENDYLHYPHGWIGLPTESAIKILLEDGAPKTVESLTDKVLRQWVYKVGVKEKLEDVIRRKIQVTETGYIQWKN